ncbi:alpha/beta hydrolase fold domain-containing protein [Micromonosporaceae bacterium Da 78-11]
MPSLTSRLMPGFLFVTRANRALVDSAEAGRHLERVTLRPRPYAPPRLLRRDVRVAVTHPHGWPVYTLTPKSGPARGGVIYAHGGAWVNEIAPQHWQLAARIAAQARTTVTVPIYPLVPFGTAEKVVAAFVDLVLASTAQHGPTALAGDSAGGQIALSTAVVLRDEHQVTVPRTVLIAPAVDLSLSNPEIDLIQPTDPWLGRDGTRVFIERWRADLPLTDPRVSPLAADLAGLGPLTVFCGTRDICAPDSRLLVSKATAAGVDVDYHEGAGLLHVYPLTPTPEGRAARTLIVRQLRAAVAAPS